MGNNILLFLTTKDAALAAVDIQGFNELIFAIHALKLNVSIAGRSSIVFFVLVSFLQNGLRFLVFFLY